MPNTGLVAIGSVLYGTTYGQGTNGGGTVFSADAGSMGALSNDLYDFPSGSNPLAGLTLGPDGNLYGITPGGGANGVASVFQFNPTTNPLTTIYAFNSTAGGYSPSSVLKFDSNGNLYGATPIGNTTPCNGNTNLRTTAPDPH